MTGQEIYDYLKANQNATVTAVLCREIVGIDQGSGAWWEGDDNYTFPVGSKVTVHWRQPNLAWPALVTYKPSEPEGTGLEIDIDEKVAEHVRSAQVGEEYHANSGGYRANGFRITISNLEAINQLLLKKHCGEIHIDQAALDLWEKYGHRLCGLAHSVRALEKLKTPFAKVVRDCLLTVVHGELKTAVRCIPTDLYAIMEIPDHHPWCDVRPEDLKNGEHN